MNPNLRRILVILAFIVVTVGFFYLIWLVFFRSAPTNVNNRNGANVNGLPIPGTGNLNRAKPSININALPAINTNATDRTSEVADGGPTLSNPLTTGPTLGMVVNPANGNLQFYDGNTGQFFVMAPDGSTKTLLTDTTYPDVQSIYWSPDGKQAILTFPDGAKILYNFDNKKQTTLPNELDGFSWSPSADKIASKYLDAQNTENQWLLTSQPDGSQSIMSEHLGANAGKVTVDWSPNQQIIAMYEKTTNTDQSQIIFLGANGENFPSVDVQGRGFDPHWSPDGRQILYSTYSELTNDNPHLYLMNGTPSTLGTSNLDLGLNTTADKCAFAASGLSIYCAVPYYLNPGSGPQPELSAGIPDNIYKINLQTGAAELIARPVDSQKDQKYSVTNPQVSPDESSLFFTDATTGTVQRIQLR